MADKQTTNWEDFTPGPGDKPLSATPAVATKTDSWGEGDKPANQRTLGAVANDTVIEVANAAAGGLASAANFIKPGNAVSGWIDKNIVKAGEDSQSDVTKAAKQQFREEVQNADGVMGELGAVGKYVVQNPLLTAAQAGGSFVGPAVAVKGFGFAGKAAGLGAQGVERAGRAGGVAAGAAMAGGDAAGTAYELSKNAGATEDQAVAAGRQASVIPAVVGGVGGMFGAENLLAGAKGFGGGAVSRALKTGASEALQEGVEEGVTQYEGQRAAMPYDASIDPAKGVAAAAGMGAALGGITGAGTSLLVGRGPQPGGQEPAPAPVQPPAQPPAPGPTLALPAPDRGVIAVGADGTARTPAYQTPGYVGDVTDVRPKAIDPVREQVAAAAEQGGALSGAALTAIDTGVTQAMQPEPPTGEPRAISLEEADARDQAAYEQFFSSVESDSTVSRYFEDDTDIPDFDTASNVSDEEFLRSLGATDEDIQDAIATARQPAIPQSSPAVDAGAQANEPTGTRQVAGADQATQGQVAAAPVSSAPTNLRDGLARIRAQKQEAANAQAAAPRAAPAAAPVPDAGPAAVEAAGPAVNSTTTGVAREPSPNQAIQASPQPAQAGKAPAAGPATSNAGTSAPAGTPTVRALSDGTPAQNLGAQVTAAPGPKAAAPAGQKKAIDRVNSGKAYYFSKSKAQSFVDDNGLNNTHEVVQDNKRFVVRAKPVSGDMGDVQQFAPETGTLGIPRAEMPQVPAQSHGGLVKHLNAQGIEHETTMVDAADLKPTQAEYSPAKVEQAKEATGDRAVIVSNDGHIIDGHHQALAAAEEGKPVKAIVLDVPVEQALEAVMQSPSVQPQQVQNATKNIANQSPRDFIPATDSSPDYADGQQLGTEDLLAYFDKVIASSQKGERIVNPRFQIGEVDDGTAQEIARYINGYDGRQRRLRVSGRTIKHIHESRPAIAREIVEQLPGMFSKPDEVLPDPRHQNKRALLVKERKAEEGQSKPKSYVATVEVEIEVEVRDGFIDIVTIMTAPERSLKEARELKKNWPEGQQRTEQAVNSPHPLTAEAANPAADSPDARPVGASVPPTGTAAQPITRADVAAAQQQAATLIGERIDAMTAGEVNTIARRFLPTMGVKPTVSKERNKAAVTDFTKVNPVAAAAEFGVTLPADVRRALDAEMQGRVADGFVEPAAAAPQPAAPAAPITDFGEKIGGARKDVWSGFKDDLNKVLDDDIAGQPLTKVWPAPDYQKLIDAGMNAKTVAAVRALRDEVPAKPRAAWKVKRWAEQVKTLRSLANDVMDGKITVQDMERMGANKGTSLRGMMGRIELYELVGHEKSLEGVRFAHHHYALYKGRENVSLWVVEKDAGATAFSNWPREIATGDTKEQALAAFKEKYAGLDLEKAVRKASFDIFSERGSNAFYVGKKIGRNYAKLEGPFKTVKEAREYREKNLQALEAKLEKYKEIPRERADVNQPRVGVDMRNGQDVTPQMFGEVFGFRGVEFGNWVEQKRRQKDLNDAFDALMDMAAVLDIPPKAISLNGQLGLAFGARGSGGVNPAAAHYEPDSVVINLTKKEGAGSLGHEWWHALDNYFAKQRKVNRGSFMTTGTDVGLAARGKDYYYEGGIRQEMIDAFGAVVKAINLTAMKARASTLDGKRTKDYWTTGEEMSARAFESYLISKLQDQNASNDYLANVVSEKTWDAMAALGMENENSYPYPTAAEIPAIRAGFDHFFQTVETRETEGGNVAMFSSADSALPAKPLSLNRVNQLVQEALSGIRGAPPVEVTARPGDIGLLVPAGSVGYGVTLRSGDIYVFQSAMGSDLDVFKTVFHELFHRGVRVLVPKGQYVQTMLDLAKGDSRIQQLAIEWKNTEMGQKQKDNLRQQGYTGAELTGQYEALAIEEALAAVAEEIKAEGKLGSKPKNMTIRFLANWLAKLADLAGMKKLAQGIRLMTYNEAERFVMSAIDRSGEPVQAGRTDNLSAKQVKSAIGNNGDFDPANADIRFRSADLASRATEAAKAAGDAIKAVTVTNIKQKAGFKLTDYLGIGLQALGRRQIVDLYGDMLPLAEYNRLVQQMEADKNEGGAEADQLVTRWAKLSDEGKLANLMHDATLAQIDPAKPYEEGDDKAKYTMLRGQFNALTDAAKQVYTDTRDSYQSHHEKVRSAIKERIERSEIKGERKAALLKQMDDEFFKAVKGVYFPLARFGQYVVTVKGPDGKVESVSRAETMDEANTLRGSLLSAFPRDKGFTVGRVMLSKEFVAERDAVGRGFMTELYQVLDKQDMDAVQRAELEDTLGQLYLSSLPDLSWAKHGIHRKGTPGFSQDARRAYAQNMFHGARYLAKLRYSDLMQDELVAMQKHVDDWREVEGFDQPSAQRVVDEMNKRHETLMNPKSNALSTALTSFGFVFHLGLSPASAMVNLSQTALVAYPVMGAKWGYGKASAALLKASAEAAKGKNDITGALNADEKAAYDEAVRAGTIDVTMAHDLAGIAQGEDAGVMWKIRPVMRWASFLFHHAERFNRQVTFVAAYRLAREAGADQKAAFEQATKATYDGHFDYGAANRPRIMQGNVAKVVLLFKQYGQNMVYTLARNAQQAIKAETPEARAQARKTLGGLLATHAAAAGVLGLPMVTTLLAAASMIGGDDDEPWDAKVALQNMLADTFGPKPAEVMSRGLSRLTPWDISGRVGLDKLIFPDVQEGLEGQRLAESAMAAALGPVAGIGVNLLKGLQDMAQGQYARGLESMMPAALRGPIKSVRYEAEGVQDKTGIVVKDEVSAAGVVGQFLGFSPSEVRNATEGKSAIVQRDRALGERRQELLTKAARATMDKDAQARAEALKEIERFNEKNPGRRITAINIVQSVRNRQKRIEQAEDGVYLPRNRRDAMDAGRFANAD